MRQDLMLRAYKASNAMEPIALLDDYVRIITHGGTLYRKVDFYEGIPPFQCIDFCAATPWGPLAAAAPLAATTLGPRANVVNLELYDEEFGQWRWFPYDNAQISLFLPAGVSKWQLKNLQVGIDRSIIYRDPLLVSTELFSWEDERPAMQAMNFSSYALTACRIIALGYRFHVTEKFSEDAMENKSILEGLKKGTIPCTPVQCAGRGAGTSA